MDRISGLIRLLVAMALLFGCDQEVRAQTTTVEHSLEVRFQLDVRVPDAALTPMLPVGWTFNIAAQGPAKDANLRVVFIDRLTINGPEGNPVGRTGSNRLVYLIAPVKDASGSAAQLVIGGLTEDAEDAPGPFGVYVHAKTHMMKRSTSSGTGPIVESQDWEFVATTGERLELHVTFERGVRNRSGASDTKFYSAKNPSIVQIHRQEQMVDIVRNVTTNPPNRVKGFSFKAGGGTLSKLFDGTEKILSWDNFVWVSRSVFQP